jgi:hypothetical protein
MMDTRCSPHLSNGPFNGVFTVKQEETGLWVAARCTDALLLDGKEAFFSTAEIGRHVVNRHERDGVADYPALDDGFSWNDPHIKAGLKVGGLQR